MKIGKIFKAVNLQSTSSHTVTPPFFTNTSLEIVLVVAQSILIERVKSNRSTRSTVSPMSL